MKKLLSFLLAIMLLTASAGAVDLYVDNDLIETDTPPTIVDGRTLVPVRAIFEAIGATVEWDNNTRTATGYRDGVVVSIQIGSTTAYVNGEARMLDVPAQIINDRTMVPARFISEAMGCEVSWYQDTQTVGIAYQLKGVQLYATPTGEKYHYDGSCNGGTYYQTTLAEINGRKLTPCDRCVLTNSTPAPNTTPSTSATPAGNYTTTVIRVVDGDTIVVNYNGAEEKVRLIGVDTPESVHPDGNRNTESGILASDYTKEKLEGKEVELEFDVQQRDMYGRLLAYVYVGGVMFNKTLLEDGIANLATYPPNVKYVNDFIAIVAVREVNQSPTQPTNPVVPEQMPDKMPTNTPSTPAGNLKPGPNDTVYVSTRSHTIHSVHDCGGMKNYQEMTRAEADAKGYKYCTNCW